MSNISRGKLFREDIQHYAGKGDHAATRLDAGGGTINGTAVGNVVDCLGAYGQSSSDKTLSCLNRALNVIGNQAATIELAPGTWSITDDVTLPSNIVLRLAAGAVLDVSSGKTLTINGYLDVEYPTSWSSGSGTIVRTETVTGPGAISVATEVTYLVTTGADAFTLADGTEGQRKLIVFKTDGGDATITPDNYANGTSLSMVSAGETIDLQFENGSWHLIGGSVSSNALAALASTANGDGASLVAIEDALGLITGTNVEDALAEIIKLVGQHKVKTATQDLTDTTLTDDDHLTGFNLVADKLYAVDIYLEYFQNAGQLKLKFDFSQTPQFNGYTILASDETGVADEMHESDIGGTNAITTTNGQYVGAHIRGYIKANATTGGTLGLQVAKNVGAGLNTTLSQGCWMTIRQLS